ncbi:oxidoreductase [Taibaiella soli]|uniref:Short-chain dehydrogenase n=1 Tax=Taibaiella soli TaxID=1649169 RepID=A0A2W2AGM3_9BACT|nr:oxidoreductase [Taibaiella soli]PZF74635.1 short-chain dehydrogenase [Taibaiella soli]
MWTKQNIPDLSGKTAMVTGANTGIGYETALALYEAGANVILACRSQENADKALKSILKSGGKGSLETGILNLANLDAVKAFATDFLNRHNELHILINNAGVMIPPASKTDDGFELQFGVNVIGHFALTGYLYPLLNKTPGSRIVTVSSLAYLRGTIDFDNLKSEKDYDPMREYAQSKLGNVLFSLELQRRITQTGGQTTSIAVQPGANKTDLSRHMNEAEYAAALDRIGELMEPWQGALPSLYAATDPNAKAGALYGPDKDGGYRGYPGEAVIAANAMDETTAKKLWAYAEAMTGILV